MAAFPDLPFIQHRALDPVGGDITKKLKMEPDSRQLSGVRKKGHRQAGGGPGAELQEWGAVEVGDLVLQTLFIRSQQQCP